MYRLLKALLRTLSFIPFRVMYVISDMLYPVVYYLVRYRREVVRGNIALAFPDKSEAEVKKIEKRFYRFFIDTILESLKLMTISKSEMKRRVRFTNIDEVNAILEKGRSISTYLGHFGNWEWMSSVGLWLTEKADCIQIYHKLSNKAMDRLMTGLRERMGDKCVEMHSTARFIANAVKSGRPQIIGFIADQSPRKREAKYYFPFLGHEVPALVGTEKITKHFGFEAMFVSVRRVKRGYYECRFERLHPDAAALPDFELTRLYLERLEREIKEAPELYLWSHRRFKFARKPGMTQQ